MVENLPEKAVGRIIAEDRRKLGRRCRRYLRGELNDAGFVRGVRAVVDPWDAYTRTLLFSQVEATMSKHFCGFRDECKKGCQWPDLSKWEEEVAQAQAYKKRGLDIAGEDTSKPSI